MMLKPENGRREPVKEREHGEFQTELNNIDKTWRWERMAWWKNWTTVQYRWVERIRGVWQKMRKRLDLEDIV